MKDSEIERKGRYVVKRRSHPPTQKSQTDRQAQFQKHIRHRYRTTRRHFICQQQKKKIPLSEKIIKIRNNVKYNERETPLGNNKDNIKAQCSAHATKIKKKFRNS